jgi:hypothetical protein
MLIDNNEKRNIPLINNMSELEFLKKNGNFIKYGYITLFWRHVSLSGSRYEYIFYRDDNRVSYFDFEGRRTFNNKNISDYTYLVEWKE